MKKVFFITLLLQDLLIEQASIQDAAAGENRHDQNDACFEDGVLFTENSVFAATIDACRSLCLSIETCQVAI